MQITKVKKGSDGRIEEVMMDDKKKYSIEKAIKMAQSGELEGYKVGKDREGKDVLRGNADGDDSNNLSNLPTFE